MSVTLALGFYMNVNSVAEHVAALQSWEMYGRGEAVPCKQGCFPLKGLGLPSKILSVIPAFLQT